MSRSRQIQILPAGIDATLSPDQQKFNKLIQQIEQSRASLQAWKDAMAQYQQGYVAKVVPLMDELRVVQRALVLAMEEVSLHKGWSKTDSGTWSDLICETAGSLLEAGETDDAELRAVYQRHADIDFEEERLEELQMFKFVTEQVHGVDLGDVKDFANEQDLYERLRERLREKKAAEGQAEPSPEHLQQPPSRRRKSAAEKRRETEAHEASISVREVYRKLASVLHPDRETDPDARARKTDLMQQANQAYAKEDLLALLELQLRAEQIDAGSMANIDPARLKHYIKVLKDQAGELKREIESLQLDFGMRLGGPLRGNMKPEKLGVELQSLAQRMRSEIDRSKLEKRMFADTTRTKHWLKAQRRRLGEEGYLGREPMF